MHFSNETVIWIADTMRQFPSHRDRLLDCFWRGQIESKTWLIDEVNEKFSGNNIPHVIHIFGGWYGVLAAMLFDSAKFPIKFIRSIDIDPRCEAVADHINKVNEMAEWRFKAFTSSMDEWDYDHAPTIVINTSCEHVDQYTYDLWWNRIPAETFVVLQGNDFFACEEHVRCSESIEDFIVQSRMTKIISSGQFVADKGSGYTRFMLMGYK